MIVDSESISTLSRINSIPAPIIVNYFNRASKSTINLKLSPLINLKLSSKLTERVLQLDGL